MKSCLYCSKETKNMYCSLSCSNRSRTAKNEQIYNLNPKKFSLCETAIPYSKRFENIYCSHSCAAKVSNKIPKRKKAPKKHIDRSVWIEMLQAQTMENFQNGELTKRSSIRRCLIQTVGNTCSICKNNNLWNGQPLTLIVDHIDGNAGNNVPSNLRLLCPNCNSQTLTFCGRNRGKGRQSRGLPKH